MLLYILEKQTWGFSLVKKQHGYKFRRSGVPTRDSFSRQILKASDLGRVEAQYLNQKLCSVEARIPAQFKIARIHQSLDNRLKDKPRVRTPIRRSFNPCNIVGYKMNTAVPCFTFTAGQIEKNVFAIKGF